MPSDNIAELPVYAAAPNLVIEMSVLPASAARMTFFEPDAIVDLPGGLCWQVW